MFEFFGLLDIISFVGWLLIFMIGTFFIYENNKHKPEFKYYYYHFYFKILAGFAFACVYMFYYERHGDTVFYWQGALKLNKLFFENPSAYFHELLSTPPRNYVPAYFSRVGYPPSWIYNEPNSWFVCKVANFFSFFSFGSYITLNLFFSVISTWISWRFYLFINKTLETPIFYNALAILFIPSVAFWCTGLIKDTIAICAIYILTMAFFRFLKKDYKYLLGILLTIGFASYILFAIRPFLLVATFLPFAVVLVFKWNKDKPFIIKLLSRITGIGVALTFLTFYFSGGGVFGEFSAESVFETAEVIQKDMMNNTGYTGKRYDLGITDFSGSNLIQVMPAAIGTTIFRPFIWEADTVFMYVSGAENLIILLLTFRMIYYYRQNRFLSSVLRTEILLYSFVFVILMGFFIGLTSGLFGTLVRLKGPVIPFFCLLILYSHTSNSKLKT